MRGYRGNLYYADKKISFLEGSITGKLLWTNSSPNSNFTAKTVNLGTSEYKYFKIFAKLSTTNNLMQMQEVCAGYPGRLQLETTSRTETYFRDFTSTASSIAFKDAKIRTTSESVSNNLMIPLYIIGYKIN